MLSAAAGEGRRRRGRCLQTAAELLQGRLGRRAPPPFSSPSPASAPSPRLFSRTIRDLCWRPREPRSWLAAEEATSWIPECEVCRKALSFGDGRDPAVSMALDKQEETVRESRYFTALKAYKHGARGRKSRSLSSKPERPAAPGAGAGAGGREPGARRWEPGAAAGARAGSREPGAGSPSPEAAGAQLPGRSQAPGPARRACFREDGPRGSPSPTARRAPVRPPMQREAAFRPGHCQPLRIMGSVDQGKRAIASCFGLFLLPPSSSVPFAPLGQRFRPRAQVAGRPGDRGLLGRARR